MGLTDEEKSALVAYRLSKSREVYQEAVDVASLGHWSLAVNRLYYSVFHACSALLMKEGHSAHTHSGVMRIVMLNYVKSNLLTKDDGRLISSLFNMRQTGDYDDLFDWVQEDIEPLMSPTKKLLDKLYSLVANQAY